MFSLIFVQWVSINTASRAFFPCLVYGIIIQHIVLMYCNHKNIWFVWTYLDYIDVNVPNVVKSTARIHKRSYAGHCRSPGVWTAVTYGHWELNRVWSPPLVGLIADSASDDRQWPLADNNIKLLVVEVAGRNQTTSLIFATTIKD